MTTLSHICRCVTALAALALVAGCEQRAEIERIPTDERASPEAREGLPELEGAWYFAGLAVALDERPDAGWEDWEGLRGLEIEVQRLDSIAGSVHTANGARSFFGEVRRDGVVSVVLPGEERVDFLAGYARADTLWLSFTNLDFAGEFPAGTDFALLREAPRRRFLRLRDGRTVTLGIVEEEPDPEEDPAEEREEPVEPREPTPQPRPEPVRPEPRPDPAPPTPRPDPTPPAPRPDPAPPDPDPEPPPPDPDPDPEPPPPDPIPPPPPPPDPIPPPPPDPDPPPA